MGTQDMHEALANSLLPGFRLVASPDGALGEGRALARCDDLELEVELEAEVEVTGVAGADGAQGVRAVAERVGGLTHPVLAGLMLAEALADGRWVLMTDRRSHQSLATMLREIGPEPLQLPRALALLTGVAAGLVGAHTAGLAHRDLRPAQVGFGPDKPGGEVVVLHGVGRVALLEAAGLLPDGDAALVEPSWAAPEQLDRAGGTAASDIYSFGVLAYRLCTGRLPFECASPKLYRLAHRDSKPLPPADARPQYVAPLPPAVDTLIQACLEKAPDDRPPAPELVRGLGDAAREAAREALLQQRAAGPLGPWKRIRAEAESTARYLQYVRLGNVAVADALAALGPHDATQQERDQQGEEAEAAWDAVHAEGREWEHRLRGAMLKLALERGRLAARGVGEQPGAEDLRQQIEELLLSLAAARAKGERALQTVSTALTRARGEAEDWARREANCVVELVGAVRERRDAAGDPSLVERIDALAESIAEAGAVSVSTLPGP